MKYKEYKNLDYARVGETVLAFWKENKIFEQSISSREGQPTFTFFEGPPSANGTPGIHHVMARTIKDIFCRYKTLQGFQVKRKGGWDTHGLPIELQVEKELGITKEDIGKTISIEEYNKKCRQAVMKYTGQWNDLTEKMGYWVDLEHPYITYQTEYIESVWNLLKKLYDKGLLYKGYTIQPYSPGAGTGLSSHELNQPGTYKDVKDTSIVAQFKVRRNEKSEKLFNLTPGPSPAERGEKEVPSFHTTDANTWTKLKPLARENRKEPTPAENALWQALRNNKIGGKIRRQHVIDNFIVDFVAIDEKLVIEVDGDVHAEPEQAQYDKQRTVLLQEKGFRVLRFHNTEVINNLNAVIEKIKIALQESHQNTQDSSPSQQERGQGGEVYFLAWTTTPWTLPANSALTVGKNITYAQVKTFNPYTFLPIQVILAKDLVSRYFSEKAANLSFEGYKPGDKLIPWKVVAEYAGADLAGIEYEQLLPYVQPGKPAFRVITGDFVTTEDGTGIVHTSPTFGADDYRVAQQNDIPSILVTDENGKQVPIVDKQGRFVKEITDFAGMYVKNYNGQDETAKDYKSTDVLISIKLKEENKAFKVEKYEHTYPHCWRTDKPVLYYPLDSWFIRTTAAKDKLIELNKTINWKPESTGSGRFGNWLENLVDWNLSRSRYWGTPLPIWRTEDGAEELCIGSVKELMDRITEALNDNRSVLTPEQREKNNSFLQSFSNSTLDLHRPYVDDVVLVSASGKPMFREPDLIDVWFDSGAMPYAQWHYPFENEDIFKKSYPADFISEGVDQTRGWFFTLHAIAGMLFDSVAFKNVVSTGLVLDKNGNKMSKRVGNVINPFDTLRTYGPDATRWYMIVNAPPWDNLKFNLEGVTEVQRRFFGTLHNTYSFFALYANLDNFSYAEKDIPLAQRTESDRWIISKLNSLVQKVEEAYDDYEPTRAARAIQDFVTDDLSNWYVRLNRKRFWKGEYNEDKRAAYQTLYTCLETVAKLISPIAPFYAEQLFLDLNHVSKREDVVSVHVSRFPKADPKAINTDLEEKMALAQNISSLVHSLRKKHTIKVRQPLSKILIPVLQSATKEKIQDVEDLILSEVNIKTIEYIDDTSGVLVKKIKPNFKKLGKEYGPRMKEVAGIIQSFGQEEIKQLEKNGSLPLSLNGSAVTLTLEDVEISSEDIPGWIVASENGLTVALDITITDELRKEGIARDVVNRVQNLRKDMGLEVQDKIKIDVQQSNDLVNAALESNKEYICTETQALQLNLLDKVADATAVEMDDFVLNLKIAVVS